MKKFLKYGFWGWISVVAAWLLFLSQADVMPAQARPIYFTQLKNLGSKATCATCHVEVGKKDLNDTGIKVRNCIKEKMAAGSDEEAALTACQPN